MVGECESCGGLEEVVIAVHRVYLGFVDLDKEPEHVTTVAERELWCATCREHYPHEVAAPSNGGQPAD